MNATTGRCLSLASARIRAAINADCTGEPPGELIESATALAPRTLNARSRAGLMPFSDRPMPRSDGPPITPDSRTTGTTGTRGPRPGQRQSHGLNSPIMPPIGQGERPAMTQDILQPRLEAAVLVMQDQARQQAQRSSRILAGLDQQSLGRSSCRGPERNDTHLPCP